MRVCMIASGGRVLFTHSTEGEPDSVPSCWMDSGGATYSFSSAAMACRADDVATECKACRKDVDARWTEAKQRPSRAVEPGALSAGCRRVTQGDTFTCRAGVTAPVASQ